MRHFLKAYADAAREPVPLQSARVGGRTLLRAATLWEHRDHGRKVNTEYIVASLSPATCPAIRLPVTFRYDAADEWHDYSLDLVLQSGRDDPPTDIFFPAYHIAGSSRFAGVEVPRDFEPCVRQVARVSDVRRVPILLNLTLTPDWDRKPLYQRLARWERPPPDPARRVYALPPSLPVARATLDEAVMPAPVLWRTPLVRGDASEQWRITGTPPGPRWPVLQYAAETRMPDDRFVLEGEVERGGVTVGLVRGETWAEAGNLTIAAAGRFAAVLAPPAPGSYGVMFVNGLDDSWFLRHAPSSIAQIAGWFHDFNDVRITRAGWVRRPVGKE
jgi:hypothetical protein